MLTGPAAAAVFQSARQKLPAYPGGDLLTGLISFSGNWGLGNTQQGSLVLSSQMRPGLTLDAGYVWVKGTHLARSRDHNPPDGRKAAEFLARGHSQTALLAQNFFRPAGEVSEAMAFEGGASSIYHGLRVARRGQIHKRLSATLSYTFSRAIDDAEEIFPHSRAQHMRDFRSERGLALYDQRHRFVLAGTIEAGWPVGGAVGRILLSRWTVAPILEAASDRPVNVLLGTDNNLDQDASADRPTPTPDSTPGSVRTAFGWFAAPPLGEAGNVGRNAFVGPGLASVNLRLQRNVSLTEGLSAQPVAEAFNLLNRVNVRAVSPHYASAGQPLAAHDPRQVQLGIRLRFQPGQAGRRGPGCMPPACEQCEKSSSRHQTGGDPRYSGQPFPGPRAILWICLGKPCLQQPLFVARDVVMEREDSSQQHQREEGGSRDGQAEVSQEPGQVQGVPDIPEGPGG